MKGCENRKWYTLTSRSYFFVERHSNTARSIKKMVVGTNESYFHGKSFLL
jgi:hypothetical protein